MRKRNEFTGKKKFKISRIWLFGAFLSTTVVMARDSSSQEGSGFSERFLSSLKSKKELNLKVRLQDASKNRLRDRSAPVLSSEALARAWGLESQYGVDALKAESRLSIPCSQSKVTVAVIDTGVDFQHPALKNSIYVNHKEAAGKPGVDDDGNGFVDDVHGWDFVTNSPVIRDFHGHGTHIAGIISAQSPEIRGVCPGVKIMSLRYYSETASGTENLKNTVRAMEYAIANKVDIINYSGGGGEFSRMEFEAMKKAQASGILVVAAAGNERSNADQNLYFPAAYGLSNILSVAALDSSGHLIPASNWGTKKVHVAAPGFAIYSTHLGGSYAFLTGTSQATAFVTGIAALLKTENLKLSPEKVIELVEGGAVRSSKLAGKVRSSAYAKAPEALKALRSSRSGQRDLAFKGLFLSPKDSLQRVPMGSE